MGLPPKRNPNLVSFPDSGANPFEFENIFATLGLRKIAWDDMQFDLDHDAVDSKLPSLIKSRAIFIGIFLTGSRSIAIEDQIKIAVDSIKFYNPTKITLNCHLIDYKETLPNYYDKETITISYVRKWNSIKNNKLGDYLIQSLNLNPVKIKSDLLLQLLDDDIDEIKDYLLESGCDIGSIAHEEFYSQDVEQPTEVTSNNETSITITNNSVFVSSPDGAPCENIDRIEYWGKWGEEKAQKLYGQLGYYAEKQNDWLALGYDFICNKPKHKNVYSEVKTISSNEPIIRLKRSQWRCMCSDSKKDNYELLIVVHEGEYLREIIRISSAWATLKNILSHLSEESITDALYRSQVEVLLGFQQNSQGEANEILINWQRLFKSIKHSHINIYPQGIPNLKIGA